MKAIGENPEREGLKGTPDRVAQMYKEIFSGLSSSPLGHIKKFKEPSVSNELVCLKDIPIYSMCEHHLMPFFGVAHVVYLPQNCEIIGLSKLARIVDCFARRPQVQERLASQIANFLLDKCEFLGVAVLIEASHLCMVMRGVRAIGSRTQTWAFTGLFKEDEKKRQEVIRLIGRGVN